MSVAERPVYIAQEEDSEYSVLLLEKVMIVAPVSHIEVEDMEAGLQFLPVLQAKSQEPKARPRTLSGSVLHNQEFPASCPVSVEGHLRRAGQRCSPGGKGVVILQARRQSHSHWMSAVQ